MHLRDRAKQEQVVPTEKQVLILSQSVKRSKTEYESNSRFMSSAMASSNLDEKTTDLVLFYACTLSFKNQDLKKYKLLIVNESNKICGIVMDQGITFCSAMKCRDNHQGDNDRFKFEDGQLFIAWKRSKPIDPVNIF